MQRVVKIYGMKAAAEFIAQLTREGLTFKADSEGEWMIIELTGGF